MNYLITIVIPVYNVEEYLDRCVKSVLSQTVKGYKIILVDDGSTDTSGAKCDKWAGKSDLITVLHKKNGGLSDARNYGTQYAETKYVTFVDSDDYVEPQYIEMFLRGLNTGADMVVTQHIQEIEGNPRKKTCISKKFRGLTSNVALEWLCYEKISTSACGKLFPKKYILENPFPIDKLYEDLWTIYQYIGRSKTIAFNKSQTYHYVQRKGSIRQGNWNKRYFDVMDGAEHLLNYIDKNYPQLHGAGVFRYFYSGNELYVRAFVASDYINIIAPVRSRLKAYYIYILRNKDVSLKYKAQFLLMIINPEIYRIVWERSRRRNGS